MTAFTADTPSVTAPGPARTGASAARATHPDRSGDVSKDRSAAVTSSRTAVRSWPLLILAVPAAAEVWSGWVGIARLTGFGIVSPLPGIWPSLHLDTSTTLPVGVEAYAAYALRAWLSSGPAVSERTRRFAKWSAMCSFVLGMAGQVTYHLLAGAGVTRAPWAVTMIVSCLPVLVLAMGTTLAHLLHDDAAAARAAGDRGTGQPDYWSSSWSPRDQAGTGLVQSVAEGPEAPGPSAPGSPVAARRPATRVRLTAAHGPGPDPQDELPAAGQAWFLARRLAAAGKPVSRRALRSGGIRGSSLRFGSSIGCSCGRPALIFDRPLMRAGTYPESGRICECSALSPAAGACRWPLLLLSAEDRPGPRQVLTPASGPRCLV